MKLTSDFNEVEYIEPSASALSEPYELGLRVTSNSSLYLVRQAKLRLPSEFILPVYLDEIVVDFLNRNALWQAIDVGERVRSTLGKSLSLNLRVVVDQDAEARDREELVLVYSVHDKNYNEILTLWDDVSRMVHQALPSTQSDRVYVRLERA